MSAQPQTNPHLEKPIGLESQQLITQDVTPKSAPPIEQVKQNVNQSRKSTNVPIFDRIQVPSITVAPTATPGESVLSIGLTPLISAVIARASQGFAMFTIMSLKIFAGTYTSMANSSGSILIGYNPDPANPPSQTNFTNNLARLMRLSGSTVVRSRESFNMDFMGTQFPEKRFILNAGHLRHESYGSIDAVVHTAPEVGLSGNYAIIVEATFEFSSPTNNIPSNRSALKFKLADPTVLNNSRFSTVIGEVDTNLNVPKGVHTFILSNPIRVTTGSPFPQTNYVSKINISNLGNKIQYSFILQRKASDAKIHLDNPLVSGMLV